MFDDFLDFLKIVAPTAAAVLLATYIYRRLGIKVPGWDPAMTAEEKLEETLGELNLREQREGRAPFVLTRTVGGQRLQ